MHVNRILAGLLAGLALLFLASQWRAIHTENVNWDEFAMLSRTQATMRTGRVQASGRPGLVTLMLVPFASNCSNAVEAILNARKLWLGFTVAYLAGVFALVLAATPRQRNSWHGAALAVALIAMVPLFLRWSLHVRTDQPALMFACWGGVLLLASSRHRWLAAAAGAMFALGYLCSQKALYIAALALVLLMMRLAPELRLRAIAWRRALALLTMAAASALAVAAGYRIALSFFYDPPVALSLQATFNTFEFYRAVFGYRAYWAMLPSLTAHVLLVTLLLCALAISGRRPLRNRAPLIASWLVLLAGFAVALFHAAAFPYFWMTLGVFPAVAIGVGREAILEVFEGPVGKALLTVAAALLLMSAVPAAVALRQDTQRVQRDALAFIDGNFDPAARGFQSEGALLCRTDPNPFRTYFADAVTSQFTGASGRPRAEAFINEFRSRPVAFMIAHRLFRYPDIIDAFWKTHYVLYRDEVMIPGRRVTGSRGDAFELDVIVPGQYRWLPTSTKPARLAFGGMVLDSRSVVTLDRGVHEFVLLDDVPTGLLVFAVKDDPRPAGANFYDPLVIHEIDPLSPRF